MGEGEVKDGVREVKDFIFIFIIIIIGIAPRRDKSCNEGLA